MKPQGWIGKAVLLGGLGLAAGVISLGRAAARGSEGPLPAPEREFRGAWVATVDNIDWPSRRDLTVEQQKSELLGILDRAVKLRLNAIVFQVRPGCDALYASPHEPWSEYLTGQMGRAPEPLYDPLAFAVAEAHRRGLELHAWFNPYRARHPSAKSEIAATHISKIRPDITRTYGRHLWLDPGEPAVQDHSLRVILDVVRRYDVDGVHVDDYFYPYKERDAENRIIPFPDDPSWRRYQASGGKLGRDDWRRENVNRFIQRLYAAVKAEKKWVKFGISPFGIWRPGHPPQIRGFDQYSELYADARKWLVNGWVDYFTPQLYWKIEQTAQSYPVLLKWWTEQNPKNRHLWPGNYTSRVVSGGAGWPPAEISNQVRLTRAQRGATGNIHFSMKALVQNRDGLSDALESGVYARPALVPASPWLDAAPPGQPKVEVRGGGSPGERRLAWKPAGGEPAWLWVVRTRAAGRWNVEVHPAGRTELSLGRPGRAGFPDRAAVSAVDRCGNESSAAVVEVGPGS